jgi:hypothetical protein
MQDFLDHSSSAGLSRATEITAYRGDVMRPRKIIRTTVGERIVAVTDEIMLFVRDPPRLHLAMSGSQAADGAGFQLFAGAPKSRFLLF